MFAFVRLSVSLVNENTFVGYREQYITVNSIHSVHFLGISLSLSTNNYKITKEIHKQVYSGGHVCPEIL